MVEDDDLTADLDPDEPKFPERMAGRIERLLQSSFIDSVEAREDFETLLHMMQEITNWQKNPT